MATINNKNLKVRGRIHRGDIMSPEKRSALMSRIRGKNTGPEIAVRQLLHRLGYRYRLHAGDLPGRPDIVIRSRQAVIFVHGCFWHRHTCGLAYVPKTRGEFWHNKFLQNTNRDRRTQRALKAAGWRILVVWECQAEGSPVRLELRLRKFLGLPKRSAHRRGRG
jgi:DNA mismatch endonuclease, patch repair protein